MSFRWYIGLFVISLLVVLGIAWLESAPGYMDADYYYASGLRIATDKEWGEPFIWNYLADPDGLPHPSFSYWMPLAGMMSALGMFLTGSGDFWSARIIFLLIAACISPLTAFLAFSFNPKIWAALLAGALGIFTGYYLVYLPTTETFAIFMLLGGFTFLLIGKIQQDVSKFVPPNENQRSEKRISLGTISSPWVYLAAGCIAGLMFMTRADGLVWLLMIGGAIGLQLTKFRLNNLSAEYSLRKSGYWLPFLLCIGSFLLISAPWMMRNWGGFGTIFAPGSGRALWLTRYDELYAFPASQLTFSRWSGQGFWPIVSSRIWALGLNAVSTLAVQGGIFLLPFSVAGMWIWRKDWRVQLGAAGWLVVFLAMTLIFPYQGARGGFFHAGAGFQTLIWALVPVGLAAFADWGRRKRSWSPDSAVIKFGIGIIGLMVLVTGFLSWQRLTGASGSVEAWGAKAKSYSLVEDHLAASDVPLDQVLMVNNPPGYYAKTGRPAIVVPDGGMKAMFGSAEKYQANYLVVDENYPHGLEVLFREPQDYPGLRYEASIAGMHIYRIEP